LHHAPGVAGWAGGHSGGATRQLDVGCLSEMSGMSSFDWPEQGSTLDLTLLIESGK
jgi:hypothetical protein